MCSPALTKNSLLSRTDLLLGISLRAPPGDHHDNGDGNNDHNDDEDGGDGDDHDHHNDNDDGDNDHNNDEGGDDGDGIVILFSSHFSTESN